jgi:hypothetical protein
VDEYTRECLAIRVAQRLSSEDVLPQLTELLVARGTPAYLRSDNGPELTAGARARVVGARRGRDPARLTLDPIGPTRGERAATLSTPRTRGGLEDC